jgi:hypothetical protein
MNLALQLASCTLLGTTIPSVGILIKDAIRPDTDQLTGDNRQNGGLGVHFSDKGLQAHGHLWAEKVEAWLDTVLE